MLVVLRPYLRVRPNLIPAPDGPPLPPRLTQMSKSNEQIRSRPRSMDGKSGYGSRLDEIQSPSVSLSLLLSLTSFFVCCSCSLSLSFLFLLFCVWNHHPPPKLYPIPQCGTCGGHLGDLFNDGWIYVGTTAAKTGKRYCIDGAALIFRPTTTPVATGGGTGTTNTHEDENNNSSSSNSNTTSNDVYGDQPPPNKVINYEPTMFRDKSINAR